MAIELEIKKLSETHHSDQVNFFHSFALSLPLKNLVKKTVNDRLISRAL